MLACVLFLVFAQVPVYHEAQDLPELPISMSSTVDVSTIPLPPITNDMYTAFLNYNNRSYGLVGDIGDLLFLPADIAFDIALVGLNFIGTIEPNTMYSRVMSIEIHSEVHLFPEFMTHLMDREQRFMAGFSGSYLSTPQFEDGDTTITHNFMVEQQKVVWDALKKTYFAKYRFQAEERLRDDAFYVNEWQGMDFVVLPPFLAGYLYYRGLDKHYDIGDIRVRALVEPGHRLLNGDVIGAVMVDIRFKDSPIGIVGSMGLYGHPAFEFIGIGTSIDAVKRAIALTHD